MLLAVLSLGALTTSCTLARISGSGPRSLILNNPTGVDFEVIKHFQVEKGKSFDYTNHYEMGAVLADVIAETKADAVINLQTEIKQTFGDFLFTAITCGFAQAKTLVITGDAIKYVKKS